jgi:DNA-binding MarR family transcriptional regulator
MGTTVGTAKRTTPAEEAWRLIGQLAQSQRGRFLATAGEFELSPPQCGALLMLEPDQPLPMRELAVRLHCDNSNVTGIVDRLEDRGLVERRSAEHDRRVKHLVVTERGVALREQLAARMGQPPAGFAHLTAGEQRMLRDLLRKALGDA